MALQKLGRYEILGELGKGAMGIVYLARDPVIGRQLAVKTFNAPFSSGDREFEVFRARFMQEAKSAGNLSHPNIVTIHDVMADQGGAIYLVMEYVEGTDLKQLMQRQARLDPRFVVDVVAQIADGLDHAHAKGVVHRDIKPANIILTAKKQAKITDFGIAHMDTSELTADGQLLGTPNYMSPEMIRGQSVDHRADIFSLGVMLYEMLTRQKPFAGQNLTVVTHRIVFEPFTPPAEIVPGLPQGLAGVLDRALAKDPGERYAGAGEMAKDLRAVYAPPASSTATSSFLTAHAIQPAPPPDEGSVAAPAVPEPPAVVPAPQTPARRTTPALWIAGIVVVLGLAVAGFLSFAGREPGDARPGLPPSGVGVPPLEPEPETQLRRQAEEAPEPAAVATPTAAAGGGERAAPPAAAPPAAPPAVGKATLDIELRSELAAGRMTIYAGQEKIYQESFQFGRKRSGVLRRSRPVSGQLTASRELAAGEVTLRIYVTLKDPSRTRTAEVDADLPAGGAVTLEITLSAEGRLRAQIRSVS